MLDRDRGMFRLCLTYVLAVLDRAAGKFRPCSRYVLTVFDRAGVCFDRARGMY